MAKEKVPAVVLEGGGGPPVVIPGVPSPREGYVPGIPVPLEDLNLSEEDARAICARVGSLKMTSVTVAVSENAASAEKQEPEKVSEGGGEK